MTTDEERYKVTALEESERLYRIKEAAPALLGAAQNVLRTLDRHQQLSGGYTPPDWRQAVADLRAAVDTALGRTELTLTDVLKAAAPTPIAAMFAEGEAAHTPDPAPNKRALDELITALNNGQITRVVAISTPATPTPSKDA